MKHQVIDVLASYLEAVPQQVLAWDEKVINHFVANPGTFNQFKQSNDYERWDIYSSIRYALRPS